MRCRSIRRGPRRWRPSFLVVLACSSLFALAPLEAPAALYISELMAVNDATVQDEDGDFSDWLEIHNSGPGDVDLAGYYLSDDVDQPTRWQLPPTVVAAGGYLLVFASGKDRSVAGAELHTNFKLSSSGEYLALVAPDGIEVVHAYAPGFPGNQIADVSYGLAGDLTTERCFSTATPGLPNEDSEPCGTVGEVEFSVERGFYDDPFMLELSTESAGATIYYTSDGRAPSPTAGTEYSGPIAISTTVTIRAAAFLAGLTPSQPAAHSYIFVDDVLRQDGAGMPQTWTADYEMDARIVDDPRYAATIADDLLAIPTLSLAMDIDDLFGATNGIYSHPQKRGLEWERPVSAELIQPDGRDGFQIECGIRIQGRLSREKNRKKSFRLAFKSVYGPPKLEFPLFGTSAVRAFDKLRLRASHNKSWSFGNLRATYVRDQWVRDSQIAMGQVASQGIFVHLYLNGMYWGLYNLVEQPDEGFASEHFGGAKELWDVLKPVGTVSGTNDAWRDAHAIARGGVSTPSAYQQLRQYVDVDNLIDYMLVNFHAGTNDWDLSNWFAAGSQALGQGFKFFSWDAEQSMEVITAKRTGVGNQNHPSGFYAPLRANEEFRLLFADHAHRHLFDGGALTAKSSIERFMARVNEIERAVVPESARWGDARRKKRPLNRDENWLQEVEWLRLAYLPRRSAIVLDQLRDAGLYPLIEAPELSRHGGSVASGFELSMSAPAGTVYYTTDDTDPRLPGGAVAPSAGIYGGPIALTAATTVKARAFDGGSWSALAEAAFVIDHPLRISELMFHPPPPPAGPFTDDDYEFIELVNTGDTPVAIGGYAFTDGVEFVFPALSLAAGETVVVVRDPVAFASRYGDGIAVAGQYQGRLDNDGERVRLETASGDAVHDFTYGDRWRPETDGDGYSLVAVDVTAPSTVWGQPSAWRASALPGGSPGAPELPMCSDTVDNDGDGATDFPADAGCESAGQDLEDPACDDHGDNDGDGLVDAADPDCTAPWVTAEALPPIDHFACYSARQSSLGPRFERRDAHVADVLDPPQDLLVHGVASVCLPAALDDGTVADEDTHLTGYRIKQLPGAPKHAGPSDLFVRGLGPIHLRTVKADRLLIPSSVSTSSEVTPPDGATHAVDHYKCYRARIARGTPKYFPKGVRGRLRENFEDRRYDIRKISRLCMPAAVDGSIVKNPAGLLLCYQARRASGEPLHARRTGVHTADRFGQLRVDTKRIDELCVPAR